MVDIVDVLLAKALTPQGEIETYARQAQNAVTNANQAVNNVSSIEEQVAAASATATQTLEDANTLLETVSQKLEDLEGAEDALARIDETVATEINNEVGKITITASNTNTSSVVTTNLNTNFGNNNTKITPNVVKYYTSTGQNTDGTMTQKAITAALANGSGGRINLDISDAGKIVVVGEDGSIKAGEISEEELINLLDETHGSVLPVTGEILGIVIDYENRTVDRYQTAITMSAGANFNRYSMYGGRKRCNVNHEGVITAWYGDNNYVEDGSNGDVMVYQPKFYYQRIINKAVNGVVGKVVRKETLLLSETAKSGFKLHPLFIDENGNELEYVLIPAYESCTYNVASGTYNLNDSSNVSFNTDYLVSRANAKPISGQKIALTAAALERMANNKGNGWHLSNMKVESANQMLFMVEYASLNGQAALGAGVSEFSNATVNNASLTGSTAILGNESGNAISTVNENNGTTETYTETGKIAVTYRGFENPWGNTWRIIGGINLVWDSSNNCAIPYISSTYTYTPDNNNGYNSVGFNFSQRSSWISAMGYGNSDYDWVYLPAECSNANSQLPVGDNVWVSSASNVNKLLVVGGTASFSDYDGLFYYACDRDYTYYSRTYSGRIMFVPTKNLIYNTNYNAWKAKMGA